jgi:iron complex outermembrane recepter protein
MPVSRRHPPVRPAHAGRSWTPVALAAAMGAVACAGAAQADEAPLQTIVVIGETSAVRAFDVPASIDVVDGAAMRSQQPQVNLSESLSRVPGLVIQNRQNFAQDLQISSRGFGARATFGVRGVRLVQDGIPLTMPDGQGQAALFDLENLRSAEVLRGPFAALYGNSSGGVVHVFTADGPARPEAGLSLWAGEDASWRLGLKAGGRSGDWSYTANASRFDTDGYREHSAARRDLAHLRIRGALSESTSLTLLANALDQPDTQDPLGLTRAQLAEDRRQPGNNAVAYDTHKRIEHRQLGASLQHRLGASDRIELTAFGGTRFVEQYLAIPIQFQGPTSSGGVVALDRDFHGIGGQWTHRTQVEGQGGLRWTLGFSSERMSELRTGRVNDLGVAGDLRRDETNRVRADDVFLIGDWQATDRLTLAGGLRRSVVRFSTDDRFVVGPNPDDSGAVTHARTVPVLGARLAVSPDLNFYASAGRGFETPTAAELAYRPGGAPGLNLDLSPAISRSVELGLKARPWAGTRVQAALFRADTRDDIVSAGASGGRTVFANAGRTRREGVELSIDTAWGNDWSAYAAFTHTRARYLELVAAGGADLSGNRVAGVPANVLHAELVWAPPGGGWSSALEWHAAGRVQVNDANTDAAAGYGVAHWRGGWSTRRDGWDFEAFVRVDNLFDKAYVGSVIVNESNQRYFEPAPGRSLGLGARWTLRF